MSKARIGQLDNNEGNPSVAVEVRTSSSNATATGGVDSGHYAQPDNVNDFNNNDNIPPEDSDALMYICTNAGITRLYRVDGDGSVQIRLTGTTEKTETFDSSAPKLQANIDADGLINLTQIS